MAIDQTMMARRGAISRRNVLALAAMAAAIPGSSTLAQATPTEARQRPNSYQLRGDGMEITYASSSYSGEPTFALGGPATDLRFHGDEIGIEQTDTLGQLVSVMTDAVADGYTQWLTVLIPIVNITPGEPAAFSTVAIQTRHLTNIAGPDMIDGALQTYEVIPLEGTAELLLF
jgi:hypothetical protein